MWVFVLGIVMFEGNTLKNCRCEATLERIETFFALAAKPVRSFDVEVLGAKMDVYASTSAAGGGGS